MAVKWAVANGNWNAGATWNDGTVPTSVDDVYLNSHNVTANININVHSITNGANSDYNISAGGYLTISSERYITATINGNTGYFINVTTYAVIYITGNISLSTCTLVQCTTNNSILLNIIGNVDLLVSSTLAYKSVSTGNESVTIVGNTSVNNSSIMSGGTTTRALTVNGNLSIANSLSIPAISLLRVGNLSLMSSTFNTTESIISGNIESDYSQYTSNTLSINGGIAYKSNDNSMGVKYNTLNILNPDTFTWKDVTEPRSNPFIILTDAEMNNRQQYPPEDEVKQGTEYAWGEKIGTYLPDYPPESVVLEGYVYDNGDKIGSMSAQAQVGCVTKEDVREGVPLIGMGVVGSLVVPSVDDVREGVVFDNGSVGTLIVQGGGDRLRIADFGYYTRSTSITYIVDLTESDKPAFADCEEIVLRSLFPTLDLDNIPDKFFDDLFIQFLRYRLLVEYYRGTSINSKFTPSEPTAEIVNYANTKCEYWLNTANLFLQLWGEKYPNSVKKDRILL